MRTNSASPNLSDTQVFLFTAKEKADGEDHVGCLFILLHFPDPLQGGIQIWMTVRKDELFNQVELKM
jgi:hypothetical protein